MSNPPEWDALLEAQAHPRSGVHVTSCLSCPKRQALLLAGAPVDITRLESRLKGTVIHAPLATVDPVNAEVAVRGRLFGVDIVGSIDRVRGPILVDYKTSNGKAKPTGVYPEHVWQLECYRRLRKDMGYDSSGWAVHYFWQFREWVGPFEHEGPVWTEEALGRFRPHGGQFTAREIAHLAAGVESGAKPESIPMVGQSQRLGSGNACSPYCEVEEACKKSYVEVEF